MQSPLNPFCFFMQFIVLLGVWLYPSTCACAVSPVLIYNDSPTPLPVLLSDASQDLWCQQVIQGAIFIPLHTDSQPPGVTSPFWLYLSSCLRPATFSGHGIAATMQSPLNPFCFFMQFIVLLGVWLYPSTCACAVSPVLIYNDSPTPLPVLLSDASQDLWCQQVIQGAIFIPLHTDSQPPGATSPFWLYLSSCLRPATFSGHGIAATMQSPLNPFCFFMQFIVLLGVWLYPSTCACAVSPVLIYNDSPTPLPVLLSDASQDLWCQQVIQGAIFIPLHTDSQPPGATSPFWLYLSSCLRPATFSGHGIAATMQSPLNPFCFFMQAPSKLSLKEHIRMVICQQSACIIVQYEGGMKNTCSPHPPL
ncbi:uncharacterized protein [Dermacentor albipictus]|uniref:uncharacterized protein n=1 Tax=Dermacentor albipictus TaxID=60249 RepID=UPI0038FD0EA9